MSLRPRHRCRGSLRVVGLWRRPIGLPCVVVSSSSFQGLSPSHRVSVVVPGAFSAPLCHRHRCRGSLHLVRPSSSFHVSSSSLQGLPPFQRASVVVPGAFPVPLGHRCHCRGSHCLVGSSSSSQGSSPCRQVVVSSLPACCCSCSRHHCSRSHRCRGCGPGAMSWVHLCVSVEVQHGANTIQQRFDWAMSAQRSLNDLDRFLLILPRQSPVPASLWWALLLPPLPHWRAQSRG
jgi:hypothetical protein